MNNQNEEIYEYPLVVNTTKGCAMLCVNNFRFYFNRKRRNNTDDVENGTETVYWTCSTNGCGARGICKIDADGVYTNFIIKRQHNNNICQPDENLIRIHQYRERY